MSNEEKFYQALESLFIGAKIEGEGGFVNLMGIKSSYYSKIKELLEKDIEKALEKYPKFKEELFDKLYSFFNRYFAKSGSIYFNYTPFFQNVYDKVYTDDKDVILFWKTRMLYYIKTDRIFKNLKIEIESKNENYQFFFDVSNLEYKKANEKRSLIYQFKKISSDGTIFFDVFYSEKGRQTKYDEIKKSLKEKGIKITDEVLDKAFSTFEAQSEVDYFINKNAKEFLQEQFKIWLYQYIYSEETEWPKERVDELQILKDIAFKIIDFISQFEDELVKIWNKPKFVLNSNYVITLDRIAKKNGFEIIEKIQKHKNFKEQVREWEELGIIQNSNLKSQNDNSKLKINLMEETLDGKRLKKEYYFLPIDTKYFKDLELEILSLFDDLDQSLDGWLIKSENYQALNTILPKFKEKVQTIYIDPPFNKEQDADYLYNVKYKDSSWITLLENRLQLAKDLLNEKGSIFTRCDYNGNMYVRLLMNEIFGEENFRNDIIINRKRQAIGTPDKLEVENENIFLFSKTDKYFRRDLYKLRSLINIKWTGFLKQGERRPPERVFFGKFLYPPNGQHFSLNQEKVNKLLKERYLRLKCKECGTIYYYDENESKENFMNEIIKSKDKLKYVDLKSESKVFGIKFLYKCLSCGGDNWKVEYLTSEKEKITDNWKDIPSYEDTFGFKTENSEILLKRVIESTSNDGDLVLDFFLGSGTTTAVAHKLKRKWIGVEMGEHFYSVVLPRMKKVLFFDKSGISKEKDVKEKYNENNAGGFFKYFELEQYEDVLRKAEYEDSDLFSAPNQSPYEQYIFLKDKKLLDALEIDYQNNKIKVDLSKIYSNIDIAETLSNLKGKWIKRLTKNEVELADYDEESKVEKIDLKNLDYKEIKKLIWW
jgi:adenine-specific DNA-methyltransferase